MLAARRSTSVSKLVAREIQRLVGEDDAYGRARTAAPAHLHPGFHLGGGSVPNRDALHDR